MAGLSARHFFKVLIYRSVIRTEIIQIGSNLSNIFWICYYLNKFVRFLAKRLPQVEPIKT